MIFCFYHSGDADGVCSAAIVKRKFPEAQLCPINYGDNYSEKLKVVTSDDTVIMVDFSLKPIKLMIDLALQCKAFYWIDHHADAIALAKDNKFEPLGIRIDGTAGCVLTWMYFYGTNNLPIAVDLVGKWDVRKLDEKSILFHYGMDLYNLDPHLEIWKKLLDNDEKTVDNVIKDGNILLAYKKKQEIQLTTSSAFDVDFGDYTALAINGYVDIDHAIEAGLFDHEKHDFLLMFEKRRSNWKFSLRTKRDDVNVSEIARLFGGGGHVKASGFETKDNNLITKMLEGKILIVRHDNNEGVKQNG